MSEFVQPIIVTPIAFKQIGETECSFFAKDCLEFIMKIIANKFKVLVGNSPNKCVSLIL